MEDKEETSRRRNVSPLRDPFVSLSSRVYLIVKTTAYLVLWISAGISMACIGVSIPDILPRVGADYETISRAMSFGSLSTIVGCAISILCDRFGKWTDLVVSGAVFEVALTFALLPWTRSLISFGISYCMFTLGLGITNTVSVYAVAQMWNPAAACPLHVVHLGFGIGGFIAPLISVPFLSPDRNTTDTPLTFFSANNASVDNHSFPYHVEETKLASRIEELYIFVGLLLLGCSVIFLGFQIRKRPRDLQKRELQNVEELRKLDIRSALTATMSPVAWAPENAVMGLAVLIGMICFYTGLLGNDGTIRVFLFSFAIESNLNISKQEAAYIGSAYNLSFTVGRCISGISSIFMRMRYLFFVELTGVVVACFCLSFFLYSRIHFWVFLCFLGGMIGSNWPAGFSWAAEYITLTATFSAYIGVATNLVQFGMFWLTGHLFDKDGPMTIMYFCFSCSCFCLLSMIVLQISVRLLRRNRDRLLVCKVDGAVMTSPSTEIQDTVL